MISPATHPPPNELTTPSPLLDPQGNLKQVGWSRQPLLDCNLEAARVYPLRGFHRWRIKRWDYYGVTTATRFFSFTLADIGYLQQVFAYVVNFESGECHEETLTLPLGRRVYLPLNSSEGKSTFDNGRVRLIFDAEAQGRRLQINWQRFAGRYLAAEIFLHMPPQHESMNIVIPIEGKRFYHNRKANCLPAHGWVEYAGERFELEPQTALGNLDWGRGIWAYRSFWVWASASAFLPDGRTLGLNLGYGFGDTSAATENAVVLDGRIHKLGAVDFAYDPHCLKSPWKMTSPDGRLALDFVPSIERVAKTDLLVLSSEVHQIFGFYRGTFLADDGERINLEGLRGFVEEHHAKW